MWFVANVLDRENDVEVSEVRVGVAGCDDDMTAMLIMHQNRCSMYALSVREMQEHFRMNPFHFLGKSCEGFISNADMPNTRIRETNVWCEHSLIGASPGDLECLTQSHQRSSPAWENRCANPPSLPPTHRAAMLFMIIETFQSNNPIPVYARFRSQGRLAPQGLVYLASWVSTDLRCCYQVMETERRELLDEWMKNWEDLVDFEVVPVMTSSEASGKVADLEREQERSRNGEKV